jgi:hypothetical protein
MAGRHDAAADAFDDGGADYVTAAGGGLIGRATPGPCNEPGSRGHLPGGWWADR